MTEREHVAVNTRTIAAPPALVWAIVSDTNRWDRAAGVVPGVYHWEELTPGDPATRANVGRARQLGFDIHWVEPPYEWVEGRYVWGQRRFLKGPVSRGGFKVELSPTADGGTRVEARAWVAGDGVLANAVSAVMTTRFRASLKRYLDALEGVLARSEHTHDYGWSNEPPAVLAKRLMGGGATDEVTSGKHTPVSEGDLTFRARRMDGAPLERGLRDRLVEFLRARPDEDLGQIRPYELARAWGIERREALRVFLHGARAGLVDLQWQLNCPTCRVSSGVADSLSGVGRAAHCEACNVDFDLDFAAHVEAVFQVNPAVRKVETATYCASSPWFRPHVFAQLTVPARGTREVRAPLPPAPLLVRSLRGKRRVTVDYGPDAPAALELTVTDDGVTAAPSGHTPGGTDTALTLRNETGVDVVLSVERSGWNADIVLGSAIATLPDFLDLFATEAPAAGVELSVSTLTVLFSDLTGSTALYERLGDARAFALVQEHFRDMLAVIARHQGAIVKTMGDAVMATFEAPAFALTAALEMVREAERAHAREGLSVKLGLHEGPCLAVRANDRLDFFGTTVNVAARLQAQAHGSQVVIMEDLLAHADIARIVREQGLRVTPFSAHLKGISEDQKLLALEAPAAGAAASTTGPAAAVADPTPDARRAAS